MKKLIFLKELKPGMKVVAMLHQDGKTRQAYSGTVTKLTNRHIRIDMDVTAPNGVKSTLPIKWLINRPCFGREEAEIGREEWQTKSSLKYRTMFLASTEEK